MAYELVMPRLGWTMEEGTFLEWLKRDGDEVQIGDIVFTVESDKAINEVEAMEAGILRIPPNAPPPGSRLRVGALLGYIVRPGEAAPFEQPAAAASLSAPPISTPTPAPAAANGARRRRPAISPRAKRIAAELGVEWAMLNGSGRTGRIIERDIRAAAAGRTTPLARPAPEPAARATPLARRVAQDLGVDLGQLAAAKSGERITRADVESAVSRAPAPEPAAGEEAISISAVRRITAERMAASAHTAAPVTLTAEVDATELVRLRNQLKADSAAASRPVPSYTDLLAKLCAEALREHPHVNARFEDETLERIVLSRAVHIGIAVDTERGLLVPVVRNVEMKHVRHIAAESAALIERARAGQLKPDEMRGGTFTITNLGMFGIDAFTPIINLPECAILGVGRIVPKQVVIDADVARVAIRHMMFLSLTFDHRLIDGAQAARFMARVRQFIEQPYLWLV